MEKRKVKSLIIAVIALALCTVALVSATYALFSDKATVNNHLKAGTLQVTLERTGYKKTYIGSDGMMTTEEKDESESPLDLTNPTNENVFGLKEGDLIAPTSEVEATLRVGNKGTIAFEYNVELTLSGEKNALAEQLRVYVNGEDKGFLSTLENKNGVFIIENALMKVGDESQTFRVKVVFENLDNAVNNAAQDLTSAFDLVVTALQKTN